MEELLIYEAPEITVMQIGDEDILTASGPEMPDIGLDWS